MSMVGQFLFAGLSIGGVYALVALGFVMIFRATNVVNFAQGEFAMLGAYALVALWQGLQLDYFMAILLALVIMAGVGLLFEITIYYPLRNRRCRPVIVATIGASIMFQNGALAVFGPSPEKVRPVFETAGGTAALPWAASSSTFSGHSIQAGDLGLREYIAKNEWIAYPPREILTGCILIVHPNYYSSVSSRVVD